ncbi:MAG: hypothetical protein ACI9ON_001714 [Limisphaerales bacterium]|jgi:hypothetical protein
MDAFVTSRTNGGRHAHLFLRLFSVCSILLASFTAEHSQAASQGSTGIDSTGNVDIHYVQGLNVRIAGFADMPLGTWSGSGPLTADDNLCIARSGVALFGSGTYRILASGDGEPGNPAAFTLSNGLNRLHYNAYFNDQTGTTGRQQLTPGTVLLNQSGIGLSFFFNMISNCAWQNANVSIEVPESELGSGAGVYSGTLTLTLIPE